jgi:hypothetical protein
MLQVTIMVLLLHSLGKWCYIAFMGSNPSGHARPWGLLGLLTEMSIGNIKKEIIFLRSKVRPVPGADNLTTIYEPIA